jgi:hypothetical protein
MASVLGVVAVADWWNSRLNVVPRLPFATA